MADDDGKRGTMLTLGPIAFAAPAVLIALVALPVIYWLLRVTPPAPRLLRFPAVRLLADLVAREETPRRTPWWLLLLRLLIGLLIIVGLARPLLNATEALPGSGPILIVVDNGWAAARDWPSRQTMTEDVIARAERQGRSVRLLATAPTMTGDPPAVSGLLRPAEARAAVDALVPLPWAPDREAALASLEDLSADGSVYSVWLSDGLDGPATAAFAQRLQRLGALEVLRPPAAGAANLLRPPSQHGADLVARVVRADAGPATSMAVRLLAEDGRTLARREGLFAAGETTLDLSFDLPVELRNEAARMVVENQSTAGAVVLMDERWQRRSVGVVEAGGGREAQPLLSELHYIERALEPFSEIRRGTIEDLLAAGVTILILPDLGALSATEVVALEAWMSTGGVLLRFAGPLLASNPDGLTPVRLRVGDRALSGPLSWTEPMPLASFEPGTPLDGLAVPDDVRIRRQVLAEPSLDLAEKTWARLIDGTPLVTAAPRPASDGGDGGWLVLVHTAAGPDWSNLPLSGLYVEMLRRIVALSTGIRSEARETILDPLVALDGFGRLTPPPVAAAPIRSGDLSETAIGPRHPPGFYGREDSRLALNMGDRVTELRPLPNLPDGVLVGDYRPRGEVDLMPWLLAVALGLVAVDLIVALALRGMLARSWRRRPAAVGVLCVAIAGGAMPLDARADDAFALRAANEVHLAYVETGVPHADEISRSGLDGLAAVLRARTAVEAAGTIGVNPAVDELAFFPLLYWRVTAEHPDLSATTIERLNDFLRNGGTLLFDTADEGLSGGLSGAGPGNQRLRALIDGLDVPPLQPVPPDHVLTRSFYLLQDFPGRHTGGTLWVEATDERVNDGVSSVIIGSNDWASAWAIDTSGRPSHPVVPGGERQREMAFRFGVNLTMYALTGNYKSDQVHVPAILERLGQ